MNTWICSQALGTTRYSITSRSSIALLLLNCFEQGAISEGELENTPVPVGMNEAFAPSRTDVFVIVPTTPPSFLHVSATSMFFVAHASRLERESVACKRLYCVVA